VIASDEHTWVAERGTRPSVALSYVLILRIAGQNAARRGGNQNRIRLVTSVTSHRSPAASPQRVLRHELQFIHCSREPVG